MWQALFDKLKDRGFVLIAVAMDQPEAAKPWIEGAKPTYPCLIDRNHHLADLYNMVNVPQAVWINERGQVVRPTETAGSNDSFRSMDRVKYTIADDVLAERNRVKNLYYDALADWVEKGATSKHVLDAKRASAKVPIPEPAIAQAHALFRLGQQLLRDGNEDEARQQFKRAVDLHPDSWNIWRQTAPKDARGLATGPEFWARVDALGNRPYYAPADIAGA